MYFQTMPVVMDTKEDRPKLPMHMAKMVRAALEGIGNDKGSSVSDIRGYITSNLLPKECDMVLESAKIKKILRNGVKGFIYTKENGLYKMHKNSSKVKNLEKIDTKENKLKPVSSNDSTTQGEEFLEESKMFLEASKNNKSNSLPIRQLVLNIISNRNKMDGLSISEVVQRLEAANSLEIEGEQLSAIVQKRLKKGVKNKILVECEGLYKPLKECKKDEKGVSLVLQDCNSRLENTDAEEASKIKNKIGKDVKKDDNLNINLDKKETKRAKTIKMENETLGDKKPKLETVVIATRNEVKMNTQEYLTTKRELCTKEKYGKIRTKVGEVVLMLLCDSGEFQEDSCPLHALEKKLARKRLNETVFTSSMQDLLAEKLYKKARMSSMSDDAYNNHVKRACEQDKYVKLRKDVGEMVLILQQNGIKQRAETHEDNSCSIHKLEKDLHEKYKTDKTGFFNYVQMTLSRTSIQTYT